MCPHHFLSLLKESTAEVSFTALMKHSSLTLSGQRSCHHRIEFFSTGCTELSFHQIFTKSIQKSRLLFSVGTFQSFTRYLSGRWDHDGRFQEPKDTKSKLLLSEATPKLGGFVQVPCASNKGPFFMCFHSFSWKLKQTEHLNQKLSLTLPIRLMGEYVQKLF